MNWRIFAKFGNSKIIMKMTEKATKEAMDHRLDELDPLTNTHRHYGDSQPEVSGRQGLEAFK